MEYNKIVVPLDGSNLAESVLPHVEKIALGCTLPSVVLVTVTEPVHVKTPERCASNKCRDTQGRCFFTVGYRAGKKLFRFDNGFARDHRQMAKTGYDYLSKIAAKLQKRDTGYHRCFDRDVAEEITRFAKMKCDLIVMASSGKKALKRWDVGNAAEKVSHSTDIRFPGETPAVLKRPSRSGKAELINHLAIVF